jgi:hypothetical protein
VFLVPLVLLDWGIGELTPLRAVAWSGLSVLLLAVLWPPRIVAGQGWLAVRGLLRTRRVTTDALVGVWQVGDVAVSLLLRDIRGRRVEVSLDALVADPLLWHLVETGIHRSQERGMLRTGAQVVIKLGERVDAQAKAILRASMLR